MSAPAATRRGVVFVREIVPRAAIAITARVVCNENYVARPMGHRLEWTDEEPRRLASVAYRWRHAGTQRGLLGLHHAARRRHRRVPGGAPAVVCVASAASAALEGDVGRFYGAPFDEPLRDAPRSSFVAEGSRVVVYSGRRID